MGTGQSFISLVQPANKLENYNMNIKSLFIGSAAALVAFSGARAADAVVAEPEAVEYVRVCDAAGAGFFYIPGGETCLKIGGYVRYQISYAQGDNGWNKSATANLQFSTWSDTELGALTSYIEVGATRVSGNAAGIVWVDKNADGNVDANELSIDGSVNVNHAYMSLGGLSMGYNGDGNYDGGLDGEGTAGGGAGAHYISYKFTSGAVSATLALEEETNNVNYVPNVVAKVSYSAGSIGLDGWAAYDDKDGVGTVNGFSLKGRASVAVGDAGSFKLLATYNNRDNFYSNGGQWSIGASYSHKLNEKLALTGAVQYIANTNFAAAGSPSKLNLGAVVDYTIVPGFAAKLAVTYSKPTGVKGSTSGFLRFQRSF
jgi:Porin subfamily